MKTFNIDRHTIIAKATLLQQIKFIFGINILPHQRISQFNLTYIRLYYIPRDRVLVYILLWDNLLYV